MKRERKPKQSKIEIGLETLANKYGLQKIIDAVARMAEKG